MKPDGGVDPVMYHMLHTSLSLDDALALQEIEDVQKSWFAASRRNDERISDILRDRQERDR